MTLLTRLLIVAVLLLSSGCDLFKKVRNEGESVAWRRTLNETRAQRPEFEKLSMSGRIRVNFPNGEFDGVSASYRIDLRKDSAMLIRLSKFIEVARIKVDRDSIYVLDRLGGTYRVCDFSLAKSYTGLDVDFDALQALILGDFDPIPSDLIAENVKTLPHTFIGTEAGTDFRYFIDPLLLKLLQFEANDTVRRMGSTISYSEFTPMAGTQVPQLIRIYAFTPDTVNIELSHRRMDFEAGKLSFELGNLEDYKREGCDF